MGIVQSCGKRNKDPEESNKNYDFLGIKNLDEEEKERKMLSRMSVIEKKNYGYIAENRVNLKQQNYELVKEIARESDYGKSIQRKVIGLIQRLGAEKNLVISDRIASFYNYGAIRKILLINKGNIDDTFNMIIEDIRYKMEKFTTYKTDIEKILGTRRFFFCGLDANNTPIVGIMPNYQKHNVDSGLPPAREDELTTEDYENFYIYLFENIFPDLIKNNKTLMNKLVLLFDFEKGPINSEIIKTLLVLNYKHYLGVIQKIVIVNIVIDTHDKQFSLLGEFVKSIPEDLFVIMDHNFKKGIQSYIKPDAFLKNYGGNKLYKNSYNFYNQELSFDFV